MQRVVLGLDIGVSSIGWSVVKLIEEKYSVENSDGDVSEKYKISDGSVLHCGVRTFQIPQDRQQKSLAVKRGDARRGRRRIKRKVRRLDRLMSIGREYGLIGNGFDRSEILKPKPGSKENNWDIWWVRKEALERKLTDTELFRVLYHIAKHRGFYFHSKAEESEKSDDKEAGQVKAGLSLVRGQLEKDGWVTVGQMFWEKYSGLKDKDGKGLRLQKRKHNKKDNYQQSIHRLFLKEEIEKIFEVQQSKGNSKANPELLKRYIDEVLMSEKGIDDNKLQKMMKHCDFTGEICAPKESYSAERFSLLNRLNTLELLDVSNKNKAAVLEEKQREKIIALAYKNAKVTFTQIRKELKLEDAFNLQFNLCSYREKNPEYSKKFACPVFNGQLQFSEMKPINKVNIRTGEIFSLDKEIRKIFESKKLWSKAKQLEVYYSDIRKQLQMSEDFRFLELSGYTKSVDELGSEGKYIKQFETDTFYKLDGYHKIKNVITANCGEEKFKQLAEDTSRLDVVSEALTYCKSDETRSQYLRENGINDENIINAVLVLNMSEVGNFSIKALINLLKYMEAGDLYHDAKVKCGYGNPVYDKQSRLEPYEGFFEKNPVVSRVISQVRKVVNAIVRKYGSEYAIDQINIEVGTDLASSKKRKDEIAKGQQRYREDKEAARARCIEFGLDPDSGQTLLMFRLAEEQNHRCPYTNTAISFSKTGAANEVYVLDCEIDHVIPMSRSFNDSLNNKVLCVQKANQDKRDRIPYEWFTERYEEDSQQWHEFEKRVKKFYSMPYTKRVNLLRKSWTDKDKENFISRNLNDTRYATRHVADYLRKYFDFSSSNRDDIKDVSRIQLRSGGITAFLRHMWGLQKDRDVNNLHHAIDAMVVACSTYGHVYLVSNLAKEIERKGKNWYKHFGRDKFKPWDSIRDDIEKTASEIFVSRMPRHTVTGAGHKDGINSLKEASKNRIIMINGGYSDIGPMVRADVFTDEKGWNYMVPIYSMDIVANRPLPDKYINKNDAPYEEWPSVEESGLSFKFSLFKDDLVEIDGIMYYIDHIRGTRSKLSVKNINGSSFKNGINEKEIGYRKISLKKYSVDILGCYKEIKQEKRQLNKYEKLQKKGK